MPKQSKGIEEARFFHEYMLKQLEMSNSQSRFLSDQVERRNQIYITLVSIILSGAVILVSSIGVDHILIIGIGLLLLGGLGIWRSRYDIGIWKAIAYERQIRKGIHQYYQKLDPVAFKNFGGEVVLQKSEIPNRQLKFSPAPWEKIKTMGIFRSLNGLLLAGGSGLLGSVLLSNILLSLPSFWTKTLIPLFLLLVVLFVYIYWISSKVEKAYTSIDQIHKWMEFKKM